MYIQSKPRPITAQGGIDSVIATSIKFSHSSKKVQDVSFFVALLQSKAFSIETETKRIEQQLEKIDEEIATLPVLKEAHRIVLHEVTALEQHLTDFSLAVEKTRRRDDPAEIQTLTRQGKIENETLSKEADEIFKQRHKRHREIEDIERDIHEKHNYLNHYFDSADASKRESFHEMMIQMHESQNEKNRLDCVMEALFEKKRLLMTELEQCDGHGKEYNDVCYEIEMVRSEIYRMDDELRLLTMDPGDAQSILEKRIEDDNAHISEIIYDESIIEENTELLSQRKQEFLKKLHDINQENEIPMLLAKQYMDLAQMDSIYSQKLQVAHSEFDQKSHDLAYSKAETVKLLNDISDMIAKSRSAVPSQNEIRKCKDFLVFKRKSLEMTQETIERLNYEKEKRILEVKKSEQLEERIQEELRDLTARIDQMSEGVMLYEDLQNLQENSELAHDYLVQMKERYQRRFNFIDTRVSQMEIELEKVRNELDGNELWRNLQCLEKKLQKSGEAVCSLEQSIHLKSQETDYANVKKNCLMIVGISE